MNVCIKLGIAKGKKNGLVALKLDISKTYNIAKQPFFKPTMERLSFSNKRINLIMDCIIISSFSIIINEVAKGLIHP